MRMILDIDHMGKASHQYASECECWNVINYSIRIKIELKTFKLTSTTMIHKTTYHKTYIDSHVFLSIVPYDYEDDLLDCPYV